VANPYFVGAGPAAYDAITAFPASIAVSDSTPANVATGDRVLLFVTTFANLGATTTCPTPSGWTLVDSRATTDPVRGHVGMYVFTARWTSAATGATVSPTITTSASAYSWRLQTAAWRPSKAVGDTAILAAGRFNDNTTGIFGAISNSYGTNGSMQIAAQITRSGTLTGTGPTSVGGLTLELDQAAITDRGGAFRMADQLVTSNVSISGGQTWARTGTTNSYTQSIGWHGFLDAPSDDPALGTGWSVDRIKY
jgi:hypothetical protein